jgi:hypothetical protein
MRMIALGTIAIVLSLFARPVNSDTALYPPIVVKSSLEARSDAYANFMLLVLGISAFGFATWRISST